MKESLRYTIRPNGTALYLPDLLADSMGIAYGDRLTKEQFENHEVQGLIARRIQAEKERGRGK